MTTLVIGNSTLRQKRDLATGDTTTFHSPLIGRARLYVDNYTPTPTLDVHTFTECSATGYAITTLLPSSWVQDSTTNPVTSHYPTISLSFSDDGGGQTIYGVYCDDGSGHITAAGRFATPFTIPSGGGVFAFNITYVEENCP